jgi:hypothetical protein
LNKSVSVVLNRESELYLYNWIISIRNDSVPVSSEMIKMEALLVSLEQGIPEGMFTASYTWLTRFKECFRLSLRSKTQQGQISPDDMSEQAIRFQEIVKEKMLELGVDVIYNANQTAVQFETIPSNTIDLINSKHVWMKSAGKEKERVSCMLLGCSNGTKFPPFVFKQVQSAIAANNDENIEQRNGFGPGINPEVNPISRRLGIPIHANTKVWFTGPIVEKWLRSNFVKDEKPKLLLLDKFSGHTTEEVSDVCHDQTSMLSTFHLE